MKRNGYTLIEMVIAAGLVGLLSVGVANLLFSTLKSGSKAHVEAEVKSQGDFMISSMERTIRNAIALPENCLANPPISTLSFYVRQNLESNQLDHYEYISADSNLTLTVNDEPKGAINGPTVSVTDVGFTCSPGNSYTPGTVSIKMTVSPALGNNPAAAQVFQTSIALRNM